MSENVSTGKQLSEMQAAFVEALALDPGANASRAARRAGYSKKTAQETAHKLLHYKQFAHVAEAYAKRRAEVLADRRERMRMSEDDLIAGLEALANGDPRAVYRFEVKRQKGKDGKVTEQRRLVINDTSTLWPDEARQLAGIKETAGKWGTSYEVRSVPPSVRLQALRTLAQVKGMLKEGDGGGLVDFMREVFGD